MSENKEDLTPKKLPPDEEMILEAVAAIIIAGMALYNFCDVPCHAHLLNQKIGAN